MGTKVAGAHDKNYKMAVEFGLHGLPAAVLIGEDGTILSESAVGLRSSGRSSVKTMTGNLKRQLIGKLTRPTAGHVRELFEPAAR